MTAAHDVPMTVHLLDTGTMEADLTWLLLKPGENMVDVDNKDKPRPWVDVPTHAVLIDHPEGRVLWDTGVPRDWATRWAPTGLEKFFPVRDDPAGDSGYLDASLAQLELTPDDIDILVLSHLHFDHAANAKAFAGGKTRIMAASAEIEGVKTIEGDFKGAHLLSDFSGLGIEGITGDAEILPGVSVIQTPGHTWGTMSLMVDLPEAGTKIFTSDAVYLSDSWGPPPIGAAIVWNSLLWLESVEKLRAIAQAKDAQVIFGHDAQQKEQLRFAPEGYR